MSMTKNLGNAVREARESSGMSQRQLAVKMGITEVMRTWISKIENSKVVPTLGVPEKLAAALDIRVSSIIISAENYEIKPAVKKSIVVGLVRPVSVFPKSALVNHNGAVERRLEIGRALGTLPRETR